MSMPFSSDNLNYWINFFLNRYFFKNFFVFFKKLLYFRFGLVTNQLMLSYNFHLINNLSSNIFNLQKLKFLTIPHKEGLNNRVINTITTVSFSFHKDTYNTLIFFIFSLLLTPHVSSLNEFNLRYSYIVLPDNHQLFLFINLFYFRINNF